MSSIYQSLTQQILKSDYIPKQKSPGIESPMISYKQYQFYNSQQIQTETQNQFQLSPLSGTIAEKILIPDQDYSFFENNSPYTISNSYSSPLILSSFVQQIDSSSLFIIMKSQQSLKQYLVETTMTAQHFFNELLQNFDELLNVMKEESLFQQVIYLFVEAPLLIKKQFFNLVQPLLITLSNSTFASRTIQRCIQHVAGNSELEIYFVQTLFPLFLELTHSINGNHYILKVIEYFSSNSLQLLFDFTLKNVFIIACNNIGCCVLQKLFERATQAQYIQSFDVILVNASELVKNDYGNYVFQYFLQNQKSYYYKLNIDSLINQLKDQEIILSLRKASSHVIEKAIVKASHCQRSDIALRMMNDETQLVRLASDQYGNYVIQRLLQLTEEKTQKMLKNILQRHKKDLMSCVYSKGIVALL